MAKKLADCEKEYEGLKLGGRNTVLLGSSHSQGFAADGGGDRKHYQAEFQGLGRNAGER